MRVVMLSSLIPLTRRLNPKSINFGTKTEAQILRDSKRSISVKDLIERHDKRVADAMKEVYKELGIDPMDLEPIY